MSNSLRPHGLQHTRLPCPSPSPRVCSNSCPWSRWFYLTISSSVVPFSSCLQSFLASGPFLMSWFFVSGGQSIEASASAWVLPMNIQGWFPVGLTGLISLWYMGLSRVFSNTTIQKHQFFGPQPSLCSNSHIWTWVLEKPCRCCSVTQSYSTFFDPLDWSMPGFPVHHQLSELTQTHSIESVTPSNHLILCCPLLLLPSILPSIRVFSNESVLRIRWTKYWSFSFSTSPSSDYSGLI